MQIELKPIFGDAISFPVETELFCADWQKLRDAIDRAFELEIQVIRLHNENLQLPLNGLPYQLGNAKCAVGAACNVLQQCWGPLLEWTCDRRREQLVEADREIPDVAALRHYCTGALLHGPLDMPLRASIAQQVQQWFPGDTEADRGGLALAALQGEHTVLWCRWWLRQWELEAAQHAK